MYPQVWIRNGKVTINLMNGAGVGLVRQLFPVLFDISHASHIRLPSFLFHGILLLRCRVRYVLKGCIKLEHTVQKKMQEAPPLTHWPLIGWLVFPVKWSTSILCHEWGCFQLGHRWCRWRKCVVMLSILRFYSCVK